MATKYFALLTNIGAAKLAKATALGTKVEITQMAVGDGNGVLPTPDPAQTALIHEIRRAPLNMLTVDPANASQIIAEQVIPEDVGGWWIREIGLFDKDGDMIAVANCAETYKPQLQEGSGRVQAIRVILIVSSTEAVTLKIDPAVVLATRQYVDNKIIEVKSYADGLMRTHEQSRNHPDATTTAKGFTQLNSSVTDDSETQAATPKAVKIAMDNAGARLAKDRNLADLPNPALARQNLQLGDSSTKNTGTTANTVAAGDDARITGAMQKNQNGADIPDVAKFLQNLGLVETINRAAGALQKSGDHMTGGLTFDNDSILAWVRNTDFAKIGFKNESDSDADSYMWFETGDNGDEYFKWRTVAGNTTKDLMTLKLGLLNVLVGAVINGSLGIGTTNALGGNSIALGDNDTGFKQNGDGVLDAYSNSRQVMRIVPGAVQIFGSTGSWIYMREQICFSSVTPVDKDGASAIVRQEHPDRHFILGGLGNHQFGIYMINKSRTENGTDGQAYLDENGHWQCGGQIFPGSYANFDARYQSRDNYATQAWVLQNFVQNIDLTAPAEVGFRDGWGYPRGTDGAAMYNFNMVGGSSNVGNFIVRYTRKQVNNTWYVIN